MAIVLEDEAQAFSVTDVTTLDVVMSGTPTDGWVLIGAAARRSLTDTGCTITGPSGFTDKIDANTMTDAVNSNRSYIKYKVASSEASATYTFTNAGTDTSEEIAAWIGAYSGMRTDSFTGDTDFDSSTATGTSTPSLSVTTTGTLSLIVHVTGFAFGGGPNEWPITDVAYTNSFTNEATVDGRVDDGDVILLVGTRTVTSATAYATVASWTQPNATPYSCCMTEFFGVTSSPPVNTVSADSEIMPDLDTYTAVPSPPTVASGSSSITSVTVSCDVGTLNFTASGSVTLTNNNTSSVALTTGATDNEYNTVLATITHSRSTHGQTTFTVLSSDGTLTDSDQFTRLVSPQGLTISGTHAQVRAALPTLLARLDTGETTGTFVIVATDSQANTDTQTVTLMVNPSSGDGDLHLLTSTHTLTDVIM